MSSSIHNNNGVQRIVNPDNILTIAHIRDPNDIELRLTKELKLHHEVLIFRRIVFTPQICASISKSIIEKRRLQQQQQQNKNKKMNKNNNNNNNDGTNNTTNTSDGCCWKKVELRNVDGDISLALSTLLSTTADHVLEELQIVVNNTVIRDEAWFAISVGIQTHESFETLRITTQLVPSGLRELSQGLAATTNLKTLDFSWSTFESSESVDILASALRQQNNTTCLKSLSFMGCYLSDEMVSTIIESIQNHSSLEYLNINSSKVGISTTNALESLLMSTKSRLQNLDTSYCLPPLSRNNNNSNNDDNNNDGFDFTKLALSLQHNTTLQIWDLTNCNVVDSDIELFGQVLSNSSEGSSNRNTKTTTTTILKELCLARNKISDDGIIILANYLPQISHLEKISLWGNPFEDDGAKAIAHALKTNYSIKEVDLFRNFGLSSQKIQYYTKLNCCGRKLLFDDNIPLSIWPIVLERIEKKVIEPPSTQQQQQQQQQPSSTISTSTTTTLRTNNNNNSQRQQQITSVDMLYYFLRNSTIIL